MTNKTLLWREYGSYDRMTGKYAMIEIFLGDTMTLKRMNTGTTFRTESGELAVLAHKYHKTAQVRIVATQEIVKIPLEATGTVLAYDRYKNVGIPQPGQFVQPRVGEHNQKVGVVVQAATSATYVVFPDVGEKVKYSAKDLAIVQARIELI